MTDTPLTDTPLTAEEVAKRRRFIGLDFPVGEIQRLFATIAALTTENATLNAALEMREDIAQFLFARLDDIDTASDVAKLDDVAYRRIVERIIRRRFEVASTDGYTVTWLAGKEHTKGRERNEQAHRRDRSRLGEGDIHEDISRA